MSETNNLTNSEIKAQDILEEALEYIVKVISSRLQSIPTSRPNPEDTFSVVEHRARKALREYRVAINGEEYERG